MRERQVNCKLACSSSSKEGFARCVAQRFVAGPSDSSETFKTPWHVAILDKGQRQRTCCKTSRGDARRARLMSDLRGQL